jgi:hypothetical protein
MCRCMNGISSKEVSRVYSTSMMFLLHRKSVYAAEMKSFSIPSALLVGVTSFEETAKYRHFK